MNEKEQSQPIPTSFGEYIKALRLSRRIGLRSFCERIDADPGNYSKLERGRLSPPHDQAKLEPYRKALQLDLHGTEWRELVRLAALDRGEIPPRILDDKQLLAKLPALFRSLEGEPVTENTLEELIATLRREY